MYLKARYILADRDTSFMFSVFMTNLVDMMVYIQRNWEMLVEDIRSRMGFTITFNQLLQNGSILKLEKLIESGAGAQAAETYPVRKVYPLTAMQKYFAYVIPGNTTGNLPFAADLTFPCHPCTSLLL